KSTHHLLAYPNIQKHFPPSNNFHLTPHNNHPLAIYHQTYQIQPPSYQSLYLNMPSYPLSQPTPPIPIPKPKQTPKQPLKTTNSYTANLYEFLFATVTKSFNMPPVNP
ncbi:monooxygenase family protein, partial [Bacillus pumilus]|uniref:monooxygenase family protein n=1 Tax=Bacillus pumilus TaxID=1408 RepID=UPI00119DB8FE